MPQVTTTKYVTAGLRQAQGLIEVSETLDDVEEKHGSSEHEMAIMMTSSVDEDNIYFTGDRWGGWWRITGNPDFYAENVEENDDFEVNLVKIALTLSSNLNDAEDKTNDDDDDRGRRVTSTAT